MSHPFLREGDPLSEFTVHRRDREESRPGVMGGGVLLAVNNYVQSTRIRDMEPCGYEVLVCDAKPPGKKRFAIIVAYRPPTTNGQDFFYYFRRNNSKGINQLFIVLRNWRL